MAERQTSMTPVREGHDIGRGRSSQWESYPFRALQRFADEMDRMFDDFGLGRRWRDVPGLGSWAAEMWAPEIDVFQKGDQLFIKADLPGLNKNDIKIDITDEAITIQGERKSEHEEKREGYYQGERRYGSFSRVIPLPAGAMADQARATFRDGVLEISMPSPPASTRGRRLQINEASNK
jgi:HSP20 family protein